MSKLTSVAVQDEDLERLYRLKENRREPLYAVLHRLIDMAEQKERGE